MEPIINFEVEEKKAGNIARSALKTSYLNQVRTTFKRHLGNLEKSNFSARYREGRLDRLVLVTPGYSFKSHFGSSKTGAQKESNRKSSNVKSFSRHTNGKTIQISAHLRKGGTVKAFNKNRDYTATDHISKALRATNALENLATALGNNRIVVVTSQIDF
ncbi:hypothetical protein [Flavobacterium sp. T12S277]|uniref:hypothetical protein n=1 Tax=Flavobacterium sp. T12S277 TaxID=3402752 RepID=UPI003AE8C161